jgi:ketosteroid isomerase-like protein
MSAEKNRQTALKYLMLLAERNQPFIEELVTDDCQFWLPGFGTLDKTHFSAMAAAVSAILPAMPKINVLGTTAEGDRVAVEAKGSSKLSNGKAYDNTYHYLFIFRGDRICMVKEYNDTKYAAEALQG